MSEPKLPRIEIKFGPDESSPPGPDEEPRSYVRIAGEDLPVVHVRADYDFVSSKPPRLRMEVMDHDYRFHPLSGYLIDEQTARGVEVLFSVFYAACGVAGEIEAKKGSKAEASLGELNAAISAFRNTGLSQNLALDDLKRLADPQGSAAWPEAVDAGVDEEGRRV